MTNGEKFKTTKERHEAFYQFCQDKACHTCILGGDKGFACAFRWLDLEYKEGLKPCPFCGHTDIRMRKNSAGDVLYIFCNECGCSTGGNVVNDMAIAAWNRRVK